MPEAPSTTPDGQTLPGNTEGAAPGWAGPQWADPHSADPIDQDSIEDTPADWAWVEEWRAGREPVPWGPGLALAGFTLILVATAVYVLSSGLSDRPVVAVIVNIVVAAGLGPALWLSRALPVLRWVAGGAVVGVVAAWLAALIFLT